MSQCKAYKQKTDIHPDTYIGSIPINCGNCQRWDIDIERCRNEIMVVNSQDTELRESLAWCQW